MSQITINKSLQKTLLSPLTHDKLWSQFLESMSYEISNMRDSYSSIKNTWDINVNDKDNLIRIANSFGYEPNLVLDNTLFMTRKEIESIPYRIRKKTTYSGYMFNFQQNGIFGDVFNYYFNSHKLVKAIDYNKTIQILSESNHYSPFMGIVPIKNFSSTMDSGYIILDYISPSGEYMPLDNYGVPTFSLDQKMNPVWKLDQIYIKIPTNHLGIEYFPQNYWCSYITTLGMGEADTPIYELDIHIDDYIAESIKIRLADYELPITVTNVDDTEYFQDDDGILDGADSYYSPTESKIHLHFNEIPIGKEISIQYDVNLLINPNYFYYLEHGAEYNRACPIIPHAGIFLTAEIASNRGTDFYYPNEKGYTVPDLRLKALTASSLNRYITVSELSRLDNATDEQGQPTGEENYKLDSSIKWFLDSSSEQSIPLIKNFKYIACGNHALNMVNEENSRIFNQNQMIFYYNLNTDDDSPIINDISSNNMDCVVHGDTNKIDGILSKSLNFNGDTYAYSTSSLSMEPTNDYSLGMWFNANKEPSTQIETIFDSFINISYDYENEKLIIDTVNEFDCPKNMDIFLVLIFYKNSTDTTLYLNGNLIGTFSYTMILTSTPIYIGTNETHDLNFYGLIDNLWMLAKVIPQSDIEYVYDNKISVISHMGNRIGYYEIYDDETYEDENYMLIQSYVKSMDVTNENIIVSNDDPSNYMAKTKISPIIPSYFTMSYQNSLGETVVLKTNEKGEFYKYNPITQTVGEQITGEMNFVNGEWSLAKNTIKSISQDTIDSPKKTDKPTAYHVVNELSNTDKWYDSYDPVHDTFSGEFTADEIVTDVATDESVLFIYHEDNDVVPKTNIYTSDNENYYIKIDSTVYPQYESEMIVNSYVISNDNDETHLFSIDGGKSLFHNLTNLEQNQNQLKSYVDLGESSNTTIYSINNGTSMYLNVACTAEKRVKKWQNNNNPMEYGYSINGGEIIYSNLSFSSIVSDTNEGWTNISFTVSEIVSKKIQVNLELTLVETREYYENIYTVDYIEEINKYIDPLEHPNKVPNSIQFNYWIESDEGFIKYTALVDESGGILPDENILTGNFNYETNLLYVKFRSKIKSDVVISYNYYEFLDLDYAHPITMNYKMEKSISINEIGLEDENHELMAYMTFPDIKFNDIYNNISVLFAIAKN